MKGSTWVTRHLGYEAPGHSGGGLTRRSWADWLLTGYSWAGWLLGLVSLGDLGLGRLARGTEPGPMVPTMPFFSVEEEDHPRSEKKEQA